MSHFFNDSGSLYDGVGHGFGKLSTPNWFHIGWFEFGKPFGFGTRVYSSLNQVDIGLWEGDTLVKFASGKKYRITHLIFRKYFKNQNGNFSYKIQ